jgi:hypothetical protein
MHKTVLLAAAAAFALSSGGAFAASQPTAKFVHTVSKAAKFKTTNRALSVLYDQNGTDSGIGIVSQNFETSFDAYDDRAADDFTVPDGTKWTVNEIDVTGAYFNGPGPARNENVTIYNDKGGKPGRAIDGLHSSLVVNGVDNGSGSFTMTLATPIKLKPGKYWLSVQVNMDFGVGGEWGWENQTAVAGTAAVWRNGGDGLGTGCTTWATESTCIPDGQGDHMFTIKGTAN